MKRKGAWFQNKKFWRTVHPILFRQRRWELATEDVTNIISLLNLKPGANILDLCWTALARIRTARVCRNWC
jgi:hypothetical protein